MVLFPNVWNSQSWTRPKPGAQSSIWLSHRGDGDPNTWACCLPVAGNLNWEQSHNLNPGTLIWDVLVPSSVLATLPNAHPKYSFKKNKLSQIREGLVKHVMLKFFWFFSLFGTNVFQGRVPLKGILLAEISSFVMYRMEIHGFLRIKHSHKSSL